MPNIPKPPVKVIHDGVATSFGSLPRDIQKQIKKDIGRKRGTMIKSLRKSRSQKRVPLSSDMADFYKQDYNAIK